MGINFLAMFSVKLDFHPSNILPNSMAFYTSVNMANTLFLHQNGDMEGAGQKGFLVHVVLLSGESVPPTPAPAPLQLWDSIYLLLCSGNIYFQGKRHLLSSPCQ